MVSDVTFLHIAVDVCILGQYTRCSVSVSWYTIPWTYLHSNLQGCLTPASIHRYDDPRQVSVRSYCTTCYLSHRFTWFLCKQFARLVWVSTWKFCLLLMAVLVMNKASWTCGWFKWYQVILVEQIIISELSYNCHCAFLLPCVHTTILYLRR
jgi:hypothetical protein